MCRVRRRDGRGPVGPRHGADHRADRYAGREHRARHRRMGPPRSDHCEIIYDDVRVAENALGKVGEGHQAAQDRLGRCNGEAAGATLAPPGEVSERSKERDWKSRMGRKVHRGFKSRPLRVRRRRLRCRLEAVPALPARPPGTAGPGDRALSLRARGVARLLPRRGRRVTSRAEGDCSAKSRTGSQGAGTCSVPQHRGHSCGSSR